MNAYHRCSLLIAIALLVGLLSLAGPVAADYADYVYVPPAKSWEAHSAMPKAQAAHYLKQTFPRRVYTQYAGKNAALQAQARRYPAPLVAMGHAVNLNAHECFGPAIAEAEDRCFLAGIASEGALAIRLRVDLSGLLDGETLWQIDPTGPRAFGPFTAAHADDEGVWLPTVLGDTALLVLRTTGDALPMLYIEGLSHFFTLFDDNAEKALPCPIPANCETDAAFHEVSTGVAMLIIAEGTFNQVQCSGALLNSLMGNGLQPYLLTANHCFSDNPRPNQIDVVWDYRAAQCNGSGAPALSQTPRSSGVSFLAKDALLDAVLVRLDDAPVAALGRAWFGWDTRAPAVGSAVMSNHHSSGTPLKFAYGLVTAINVRACLDLLCTRPVYQQTTARWSEGITEGGSSGAPLVSYDGSYRILGMLSNGSIHDCDTPETNIDNFASFRAFYQQIGCYLKEGRICSPSNTGTDGLCVLSKAFGGSARALEGFRVLRDKALLSFDMGRDFVAWYYRLSPGMARMLDRSADTRAAFAAYTAPIAALGLCFEE